MWLYSQLNSTQHPQAQASTSQHGSITVTRHDSIIHTDPVQWTLSELSKVLPKESRSPNRSPNRSPACSPNLSPNLSPRSVHTEVYIDDPQMKAKFSTSLSPDDLGFSYEYTKPTRFVVHWHGSSTPPPPPPQRHTRWEVGLVQMCSCVWVWVYGWCVCVCVCVCVRAHVCACKGDGKVR